MAGLEPTRAGSMIPANADSSNVLPPRETVIWRYLTLAKFLSMLELRALWLSRLGSLEDRFEGGIPKRVREALDKEAREWSKKFPQPELREQFKTMTSQNVESGRRVLVVSCWFAGSEESQRMWRTYASLSEGIAVRSTVDRLDKSLGWKQEATLIGRVKYVNFARHDMTTYLGQQSHQRALLKREKYAHEQEIRIVALNDVHANALNPDGSPPSEEQQQGPGRFDSDRPGMYLRVDLNALIERVITAPSASPWFQDLVARLCRRYSLDASVDDSRL